MKKLITVVLLLATVLSYAQVPSYLPTNGLLAFYPFDGTTLDVSGNGNNGINNGSNYTVNRYGTSGKALFFNGNSYVSTNFLPPSGSSARSFCFWAKPIDSSGGFCLFSYGNAVAGQSFTVGLSSFLV